ncbi:MAG: hypothetical protein L6R40_006792 [Gallowayella cf. fulva]|nr:MAG: hypothetical protein L6R40_006792 [Xanthomendoza cf. fulva]
MDKKSATSSSSSSSNNNNGTSKPSKEPIYKSTLDTYQQWASTYDMDGNFLQALDTLELEHMLPYFFDVLPSAPKIVDLGCGTGRNTACLLRIPGAKILGLDNSQAMLQRAESRCGPLLKSSEAESLDFEVWDMLSLQETKDVPDSIKNADAIISTLVVEHIPLHQYFMACSRTLKPGGHVLCTNMHPEMGAISQAGFQDPATGDKIRPVSYTHTIRELLWCASTWDFSVMWGPKERKVQEGDLVKLGERGRKWVEVHAWFGVILRKL